MKFIAFALIVASAQAIRKTNTRPGDENLPPWNPPAVEVAQNVYHPAPKNLEGEPALHNTVQGPISSSMGN